MTRKYIHIHFHDSDFEESKHPRAENGQFGSGGGATTSSREPSAANTETLTRLTGEANEKLHAEPSKIKEDDPNYMNTSGLPDKGREFVQGEANALVKQMESKGFVAEVQHSGSLAGPSSYVRLHDPVTGVALAKPIRFSGHSKGVFNLAENYNIATKNNVTKIVQEFSEKVEKARKNKAEKESTSEYKEAVEAHKERLKKDKEKSLARLERRVKEEQEAGNGARAKELNEQLEKIKADLKALSQ